MKKITLKPFKVSIFANGFWEGLSLIRPLTLREALYIAEKALGVNISVIKDDWECRTKEDREDIEEEKQKFTADVQGLITGTNTWDAFTNRWTCDEGLDDILPAMFIQMLYICQKRGLID